MNIHRSFGNMTAADRQSHHSYIPPNAPSPWKKSSAQSSVGQKFPPHYEGLLQEARSRSVMPASDSTGSARVTMPVSRRDRSPSPPRTMSPNNRPEPARPIFYKLDTGHDTDSDSDFDIHSVYQALEPSGRPNSDICRKLKCRNARISTCTQRNPEAARKFTKAQQWQNARNHHFCRTRPKLFWPALMALGPAVWFSPTTQKRRRQYMDLNVKALRHREALQAADITHADLEAIKREDSDYKSSHFLGKDHQRLPLAANRYLRAVERAHGTAQELADAQRHYNARS